ncbi:MAG: hypothetical protein H6Q74_1775 [Firmicutes bacterium]|nr:hypothetical protein [Bacillota bacterium]
MSFNGGRGSVPIIVIIIILLFFFLGCNDDVSLGF